MLHYPEMNIDHYESALELWKQTEEIILTIGDSKDALNFYLRCNPGLSFVCIDKENNSLVGTILCGHDGRRGFIYHLAVKKEYRNRSISKKLLSLSLAKLKQEGIDRCITMVKDFNESAGKFWQNAGWTERKDLMMYSIDLK
jgi:ribosomal protein S18 acetylase RimI-like enzyme